MLLHLAQHHHQRDPLQPLQQPGDDFDYEFVELLNIGDLAADLSGYEFYNTAGGLDQLGLTFPEGTNIAAGEFVLIVVSEAGAANYAGTGAQIFQMTPGELQQLG